ncbi:AMP-binding protein [Sphingobium sp.]|uniref:AMP-binding protein n=1 Tax=Sphingobium sp. TaxID=1912891 RepID=UPI000DB81CDB|nr:AMP-binding protein [Sphingobium sp.]PZU68649.1 MAG: hypothetical protein DI540_07825 [Sphingobium sp.]
MTVATKLVESPESFADRVFAWAQRSPADLAFSEWRPDGNLREVSIGAMHDHACAAAASMLRLGFADCRVALAATSGIDAATLYLACQYAGIAPAMLPVPEASQDAQPFASIIPALVAAFDPDVVLTTCSAAALLDGSSVIEAWRRDKPMFTLCTLIANGAEPLSAPRECSGEDPAHYLFTSGTTGQSKIVCVPRQAVVANTQYVAARWDFRPGDSLPALGSPFHSGALMVGIIMPLYMSARGLFFPPTALKQDPPRLLDILAAQSITHLVAGDGLYRTILDAASPDTASRYSHLRRVIVGGEPLGIDVYGRIVDHFTLRCASDIVITTAYGMTEAAGLIATSQGHRPESLTIADMAMILGGKVRVASQKGEVALTVTTAGKPSHGSEVRIVDGEARELPSGYIGHVEFRSPSLFNGYFSTGKEGGSNLQHPHLSPDGFFPTGDIGFMEGDNLFVVGRSKEALQIDGFYYSSDMIEKFAASACPELHRQYGIVVQDVDHIVLLQEIDDPADAARIDALIHRLATHLATAGPLPEHEIVLLPTGSLPRKPTSAKKIRLGVIDRYHAGEWRPLQVLRRPGTLRLPRSHSNMPWSEADVVTTPSWCFDLDEQDRSHITDRWDCPDELILPGSRIAGRLRNAFTSVASGYGFALVRGFDPDLEISAQEKLVRACGALFGECMPQNRTGDEIVHVTDQASGKIQRGYMSREALAFHSDSTDMLLLYCVRAAASGGETRLISSLRLHDIAKAELSQTHWDLLMRGYHYAYPEQFGDETAQPGSRVPVFSSVDGIVSCRYLRAFIELAEDRFDVRLTADERAALDALDAIMARPGLAFQLRLNPGEMVILNNYTVLHARTAFEELETGTNRLLLRLWLNSPGFRPIQPLLATVAQRFVTHMKERDYA